MPITPRGILIRPTRRPFGLRHIEVMVPREIEVGGLTIKHSLSIELGEINLLNPLHGDVEELDQGDVLLPGNLPHIGRRSVFYGFQEQGLQGETASDGVGVGLDHDEQPVLGGEEIPQLI